MHSFNKKSAVVVLVSCMLALGSAYGAGGSSTPAKTQAAPDAKKAAPVAKTKEAPLALEGSAAKSPWKRYGNWPDADWSQYNTLTHTASPPAPAPGALVKLDGPLGGNPEAGAKLAFDRNRGGSCVACHVMGEKTPEVPGNVAPDLSQIGPQRTEEWLFNYINDPRVYNPQSLMPPWGTHGIFTPAEIKDIVAFLKTLDKPTQFKNPLDNPSTRPIPVEDRDNLDPTENPAMAAIDGAAALYSNKGPKGESCASCHADPAKAFKTWAATMPKYEPRMKKVLGVEEFIARHALATTGEDWHMQSKQNILMAIYLRYLANGTPIQVDLSSEGAKAAAARGKELMAREIGQLNFACNDCHILAANKWIRGQWLSEARGTLAHFPTYRTSRSEIWDIRKRFQWCGVAIRANELPPDDPAYGDIELYLASLNEGLPLNAPGIRH